MSGNSRWSDYCHSQGFLPSGTSAGMSDHRSRTRPVTVVELDPSVTGRCSRAAAAGPVRPVAGRPRP
ncbi:hypothetical protein ACFPM0_07130 [Pseudonocardia sulfidoxydans]|uniref:hypothetical protein n=1 Tax=Pseudonocardia sulfidoxydans TaxID=54011 RepID=UPI0036108DA2